MSFSFPWFFYYSIVVILTYSTPPVSPNHHQFASHASPSELLAHCGTSVEDGDELVFYHSPKDGTDVATFGCVILCPLYSPFACWHSHQTTHTHTHTHSPPHHLRCTDPLSTVFKVSTTDSIVWAHVPEPSARVPATRMDKRPSHVGSRDVYERTHATRVVQKRFVRRRRHQRRRWCKSSWFC